MAKYNYGNTKVEEELVPEFALEDFDTGLKFQNEERIVWLSYTIDTVDPPSETYCRLLGVYDTETRNILVDLIIDHHFTEYRTNIFKRELQPVVKGESSEIKNAHKNMVKHFIKKYSDKPFKDLLEQWLRWNDNSTYHAVLSRIVHPRT